MMDWDGDAQLRSLRAELIVSFDERRAELDAQTAELVRKRAQGDVEGVKRALLGVHVVVHKLAGAVSSYGLTELGSLACALDDLLSAELAGEQIPVDLLPGRSALLSRALAEALSAQGDAPRSAASDEGRKLISDAELLLSAKKP